MRRNLRDTLVHREHHGRGTRPFTHRRPCSMLLTLAMALLLVAGCHSGGGAGPVAAEEGTYKIGYFIDSPVE
ncbi:MAG TPA: hypothetical protein PLP82_08455, partial [Deltaproteobacteria bacterium]|nr:hypothetical protein [Deltaproteobacteria bacterium]